MFNLWNFFMWRVQENFRNNNESTAPQRPQPMNAPREKGGEDGRREGKDIKHGASLYNQKGDKGVRGQASGKTRKKGKDVRCPRCTQECATLEFDDTEDDVICPDEDVVARLICPTECTTTSGCTQTVAEDEEDENIAFTSQIDLKDRRKTRCPRCTKECASLAFEEIDDICPICPPECAKSSMRLKAVSDIGEQHTDERKKEENVVFVTPKGSKDARSLARERSRNPRCPKCTKKCASLAFEEIDDLCPICPPECAMSNKRLQNIVDIGEEETGQKEPEHSKLPRKELDRKKTVVLATPRNEDTRSLASKRSKNTPKEGDTRSLASERSRKARCPKCTKECATIAFDEVGEVCPVCPPECAQSRIRLQNMGDVDEEDAKSKKLEVFVPPKDDDTRSLVSARSRKTRCPKCTKECASLAFDEIDDVCPVCPPECAKSSIKFKVVSDFDKQDIDDANGEDIRSLVSGASIKARCPRCTKECASLAFDEIDDICPVCPPECATSRRGLQTVGEDDKNETVVFVPFLEVNDAKTTRCPKCTKECATLAFDKIDGTCPLCPPECANTNIRLQNIFDDNKQILRKDNDKKTSVFSSKKDCPKCTRECATLEFDDTDDDLICPTEDVVLRFICPTECKTTSGCARNVEPEQEEVLASAIEVQDTSKTRCPKCTKECATIAFDDVNEVCPKCPPTCAMLNVTTPKDDTTSLASRRSKKTRKGDYTRSLPSIGSQKTQKDDDTKSLASKGSKKIPKDVDSRSLVSRRSNETPKDNDTKNMASERSRKTKCPKCTKECASLAFGEIDDLCPACPPECAMSRMRLQNIGDIDEKFPRKDEDRKKRVLATEKGTDTRSLPSGRSKKSPRDDDTRSLTSEGSKKTNIKLVDDNGEDQHEDQQILPSSVCPSGKCCLCKNITLPRGTNRKENTIAHTNSDEDLKSLTSVRSGRCPKCTKECATIAFRKPGEDVICPNCTSKCAMLDIRLRSDPSNKEISLSSNREEIIDKGTTLRRESSRKKVTIEHGDSEEDLISLVSTRSDRCPRCTNECATIAFKKPGEYTLCPSCLYECAMSNHRLRGDLSDEDVKPTKESLNVERPKGKETLPCKPLKCDIKVRCGNRLCPIETCCLRKVVSKKEEIMPRNNVGGVGMRLCPDEGCWLHGEEVRKLFEDIKKLLCSDTAYTLSKKEDKYVSTRLCPSEQCYLASKKNNLEATRSPVRRARSLGDINSLISRRSEKQDEDRTSLSSVISMVKCGNPLCPAETYCICPKKGKQEKNNVTNLKGGRDDLEYAESGCMIERGNKEGERIKRPCRQKKNVTSGPCKNIGRKTVATKCRRPLTNSTTKFERGVKDDEERKRKQDERVTKPDSQKDSAELISSNKEKYKKIYYEPPRRPLKKTQKQEWH